jgi:hypothetical protein
MCQRPLELHVVPIRHVVSLTAGDRVDGVLTGKPRRALKLTRAFNPCLMSAQVFILNVKCVSMYKTKERFAPDRFVVASVRHLLSTALAGVSEMHGNDCERKQDP